MALRLSDLTNIPTKPGVYLFSDARGRILYIGKAKNLKNRLAQYFQKGSVWKQDMLLNAEKVEFHIVTTESEALFLEDNLIKKHTPAYNSLLKADNSYAYIKITNEEYPQIFLTRFRDNDGSTYIWPKNNTRSLREMLHFFRQLFQFRGCKKVQFNQWQLCSDYFFGLCEWRCVYNKMKTVEEKLKIIDPKNIKKWKPLDIKQIEPTVQTTGDNKFLMEAKRIWFVPKYDYDTSKKQYKRIISLLADFFSWRTKTLKDYIMERLEDAVRKQHFEYAAQIRDMYGKVDILTEKQNVVLSRPVTWNIVEIKVIGEWYVCCMVKLFEGKIIDIIRYKQHQNDGDISSLAVSFNREVWELKWSTLQEGKLNTCEDIITCDEMMIDGGALIGIETDQRILNEPLFEVIALLERSIDAYVLTSAFEKDNLMNELLKTLHTRYARKNFPYSMECLDISHLSGWWVSGGLSAMKEWLQNKKWYRRYKIKGKMRTDRKKKLVEIVEEENDMQTFAQSDDYSSLAEVLTRRFNLGKKSEDNFLPDVFIIDWGKWQLGILQSLYKDSEEFREIFEKVQFCSLGKWEARERSGKNKGAKEKVYMFDDNFRIVEKELCYDDADRLMTQLRDEAHRFANAYRKKQMSSEWDQKKKIKKRKWTNLSILER